jgi:drug/metabolite transporter (DMT)-like permease
LTERSPTTRGYFYALLGAICSGSTPTLFKVLLEHQTPFVLSGLGILFSGFILLLYKPRQLPERGSIPYLLYVGIVGAGIAAVVYTVGLNQTTAVNASLLANGEVLFTTVIAFAAFGERLSRGQMYTALLIVAGILVVATGLNIGQVQLFQGLVGNLLILGATLAWGLENNLLVVATQKFGTPLMGKFRNLIGGGLVTAALIATGVTVSFSEHDAVLFALLVVDLAAVTYFFIAALERLGAIRMILTYSMSTVFGAIFALVFLGESISLAQLLGGAMILAGVYMFRKSEKPGFIP